MRKLASVRRIAAIFPIPGADAIECAQVDGWKVVIKKGEFQIGDLAIYFEIDSWMPQSIAPFLCKNEREYQGVRGERLRTVKLRGQLSQGLLLPAQPGMQEGDDVTELLGIKKWEPQIVEGSGKVMAPLPGFIPRTDQERVQNLIPQLAEWSAQGAQWEVTEKLDGSSMTVFWYQGEFGVCSRNCQLSPEDGGAFWSAAQALQLQQLLQADGRALALQGELIGPGIQGNRYQLNKAAWFMFDIYDIQAGRYFSVAERQAFAQQHNLPHCPQLGSTTLTQADCDALLQQAEGKSVLCATVEREGLVFKRLDSEDSFKAISNRYLLGLK